MCACDREREMEGWNGREREVRFQSSPIFGSVHNIL